MWCHKIVYDTRKQAKITMKKLRMYSHLDVKAIYYCDQCSGYHLTSQSKVSSRNYTRHNNKKNKL